MTALTNTYKHIIGGGSEEEGSGHFRAAHRCAWRGQQACRQAGSRQRPHSLRPPPSPTAPAAGRPQGPAYSPPPSPLPKKPHPQKLKPLPKHSSGSSTLGCSALALTTRPGPPHAAAQRSAPPTAPLPRRIATGQRVASGCAAGCDAMTHTRGADNRGGGLGRDSPGGVTAAMGVATRSGRG